MTAFDQRLRDLREHAGLSGKEFSEWLGVPKSTLESWLRGTPPLLYTRRSVEPGLKALERELGRASPRLPPPLKIRQRDRLAYVKRIRSDHR